MCKAIISWRRDSDAPAGFDFQPVVCDEYTTRLEGFLLQTAEGREFLSNVRNELNLK